MLGSMSRRSVTTWQKRVMRSSRATVGCEALEHRQLLSRGMGMDALGGMGGGRHGGSMMAELGTFGGGGRGAIFGSGDLGVGGGMKDPLFLLTASLLNSGSSTTPITKSVLSSSAVQSAFQTLQTDYNNDVSVGSKPTHASVGQLEDDLDSIRKGTLTGSAATSAIQSDEAAILTSLGLSSTQVSQLQSDLQAVQAAIQSATGSGTSTTTTLSNGSTTTSGSGSTTTSSTTTTATGSTTTTTGSTTTGPNAAVRSAFQTLQSDLNSDLSSNAQPTHASVGQVQDDLDAIQKGTLTGTQAVTQVQTDTAAVLTSMGLTASQVTQIQSDQAALETAIQANVSQANSSTTTSTSSSASPTSIAAVEATMQSVQQYLIGLPGLGGPILAIAGGQVTGGGSGGNGPIAFGSGAQGMGGGSGGPMQIATLSQVAVGSGSLTIDGSGGMNMGGFGGQGMGGWR
jgi:antitoxin component of RelBE/YafQ-DinJ toxin-antitoxin module